MTTGQNLEVYKEIAFRNQVVSCHRTLEKLRNLRSQLPWKVEYKAVVLSAGA